MYVAIAFMLVFTVAQFLICRQISGWPKLARQFRSRDRPTGTAFRSQVGKIGSFSIRRGGLVLHVAPSGLYMKFDLAPFYPDLLLPWGRLTNYRELTSWGQHWGECVVAVPEGSVRVRLARPVWVAAAPYMPQLPPMPAMPGPFVMGTASGMAPFGAAFCGNCGSPLSRTAAARFCMRCGYSLAAVAPVKSVGEDPSHDG